MSTPVTATPAATAPFASADTSGAAQGSAGARAAASSAALASFRSLVLPREHGSWSLALEPVALGLLVAPSRGGGWLALAVVAGFFTRRPLKLACTLAAHDPRRAAALRWTLLLAALAVAGLLLSIISPAAVGAIKQHYASETTAFQSVAGAAVGANEQQSGLAPLWPLLLAVPFGAAFLWFDLRNEMREAQAELAGSIAFALVPAAFATLAGWAAAPALALAALMLARSVPTILTVRTFLRRAKGRPANATPAAIVTAAAFLGVAALAAGKLVPFAAGIVAALLALRGAFVLSPFFPAWSGRRVGIMEAIIGLVFAGVLAAAYSAA